MEKEKIETEVKETQTENKIIDIAEVTEEVKPSFYRVRDLQENKFITEYEGKPIAVGINNQGVYALDDNGKNILLAPDRFVVQTCTLICDKNKVFIYEGDICKDTISKVEGMIVYVAEEAMYALFDFSENKFYPVQFAKFSRDIEIVGDIFSNEKYKDFLTSHEAEKE